jgi:hypothetical protein
MDVKRTNSSKKRFDRWYKCRLHFNQERADGAGAEDEPCSWSQLDTATTLPYLFVELRASIIVGIIRVSGGAIDHSPQALQAPFLDPRDIESTLPFRKGHTFFEAALDLNLRVRLIALGTSSVITFAIQWLCGHYTLLIQ